MFKHHDPLAIKRLDHLGIVEGTIDEISLIEETSSTESVGRNHPQSTA